MIVERVIIQIRRPSGDDPGQVSEGYYIVNEGMLIMTHSDGEPVDDTMFRRKLRPDDNPAALAGVLTREVRRHMLGITKDEENFNRPLGYSNSGIA